MDGEETNTQRLRVVVRSEAETRALEPGDRLTMDGADYRIERAYDPENTRRWIVLECERSDPSATGD